MRNRLFVLAVAEVSLAISARAETHELKLTPMNVHWGYYDAHLKPVLKIASGDTVRVETMVAGGLERLNLAGVPDAEIPDSLKQVEKSITDRGPGAHPLTGPIYVQRAEPGGHSGGPHTWIRIPASLWCDWFPPWQRDAARRVSLRAVQDDPV